MKEGLKEVLMRRDGKTEEEANNAIELAKAFAAECTCLGELEEYVADEFGLEPDYVDELL
jgi:hypothetical protein